MLKKSISKKKNQNEPVRFNQTTQKVPNSLSGKPALSDNLLRLKV